MFVKWISGVKGRILYPCFAKLSKSICITADVGQLVEEKWIIHHVEVAILERARCKFRKMKIQADEKVRSV